MAPSQRRLQLQTLLNTFGAEKVYFQPPSQDKMVFPCIVYTLDDEDTSHADNKPYTRTDRYEVIVIDRDPDSAIRLKVSDLPLCSFARKYVADGLNHFVYNLHF